MIVHRLPVTSNLLLNLHVVSLVKSIAKCGIPAVSTLSFILTYGILYFCLPTLKYGILFEHHT